MKKILLPCILLLVASTSFAQKQNDTTAIRRLLEKESATWRSGDVAGHADCWEIRPYSRILVSTPEGKCYDVPPAEMIHPSGGDADRGGSSVNSNYRFSVHGNDAWVSHDERSTAKNGSITYSHEIRILEKIKGRWKLVAQSIHIYVPEPTTADN